MQSIYFLVPISLTLFIFAIFAIYYAIRSRQFDDLDNEGQRVILDDRQFRRQQLKHPTSNTVDTSATAAVNTPDHHLDKGQTPSVE